MSIPDPSQGWTYPAHRHREDMAAEDDVRQVCLSLLRPSG